ncbi:MAG: hypothetical protein A3F12_07415 [Gammaproteobacteria bacterium RIFCSPHIGHO2_12_FULL_38_14]|nr:MAG: hypothetical protein A3F12_07415 [Gammaproteobacteria bacterium RIFCSPHIGHO2_12_FULL_38_14]
MHRFFITMILFYVIMLLSSCQSLGDKAYQDGNKAFAKGDYTTSFGNYLYAANQYIVPAEYALAYQYFYGLGTKRNTVKSIKWLQRAAPHSPQARYALHLIQEKEYAPPWTYQLKMYDK